MKKLLIILVQVVFAFSANGQNWQTVQVRDTNFYSAGNISNEHMVDSSSLRTMWVDSAESFAGDSMFYFFRGIRIDTPWQTKCQDTMAASWLGPLMIRKPDGSEYYFNSRGDTIIFKTNATFGASWLMAKDATGVSFQGTIAALSIQVVDGVPDSVKTISIQAMNGSIPVSDPYNAQVFQLSKAHGWLKTLDLYRFPDKKQGSAAPGEYGLAPDPYQHQRLPKHFASWRTGNIDLSWRYAPGSEYITKHSYGVPNAAGKFFAPTAGGNEVVTEDSVKLFTLLSTGRAAVTFHTNSFSHLWTYHPPHSTLEYTDTAFTETYIHTDTVINYGGNEVRSFPLYESKASPLPLGMPSGFTTHYFVDSLSNGRFSFEEARVAALFGLVNKNGCWQWTGGSPDPEARITSWIEDFGERLSFYYYASPMPLTYDKVDVTYASLSGLTWGKKINVLKLGLNTEVNALKSLDVYPNPAVDFITVSSGLPGQAKELILRNIAGEAIYRRSFVDDEIKVPTGNIPGGLYFLQIYSGGVFRNCKVVVQH